MTIPRTLIDEMKRATLRLDQARTAWQRCIDGTPAEHRSYVAYVEAKLRYVEADLAIEKWRRERAERELCRVDPTNKLCEVA